MLFLKYFSIVIRTNGLMRTTPYKQDVNSTDIRCSEEILEVF